MIKCNKCGRELSVVNDIPREDFLQINKSWGYFSKKDGKNYKFVLCEKCCDDFVSTFEIPVDVEDNIELL
ncbi:MAG: hypothetical protein K2G45_06430 [Lachnospiraceae bacterium]|nr:hypothetical protein [Lachnospiraceae bacterium]